MKILSIILLDDCLDGTKLYEIEFHESIEKSFIDFLGKHGSLQYFSHTQLPFFRISFEKLNYIKGVEGKNRLRIFVSNEHFLTHFKNLCILWEKN